MLSQETTLKVTEFIKKIASDEAKIEESRQSLCKKPNFQPLSAFSRISENTSIITNQRLSNFLADHNIYTTKQEACHLVRLFDVNGDGKLTYSEFLQAIIPKTDAALRKEILSNKGQPFQESEGLTSQAEKSLINIFSLELQAYKEDQVWKEEINLSQDFSPINVFKAIDTEDQGSIDIPKIQKFAENAELPLTTIEAEDFMLRVTKNTDGILRYPDFLDIFQEDISPLSPSKLSSPALSHRSGKSETLKSSFSPAKQFSSPSKMNQNASLLSSQSTKVSFGANSELFKTPTKKASRIIYEEAEYQPSESIFQPPAQGSYFRVNMGPKMESPLKPKEELELVKGVAAILEHIHEVETLKNKLAVMEDFTTYNAFLVFDPENGGVINSKELEEGFKNLDLHITKSELNLLMRRIDQDNDGLIRFEDFLQLITPKSFEFFKALKVKPPVFRSELQSPLHAFSEETLNAYANLLNVLIEEEVLWESIKQKLSKRKFFNLHDAYKALDRYDNGYITAEQFRDMLEERGIYYSQKDVNTLVERYAKSVRGKISYYDFITEMTPKSVEKYV